MTSGSAEGVYLFCFAHRNSLPAIGNLGLDGQPPISQWAFKDVVAVFSKVALETWAGPAAEANLQDLAWVGPRACRHEETVERVMRHSPVLPARFGTIFSSLENLGRLLAHHYDAISEFLDYMADKEEWAVKGLIDKAQAEAQLLAADARLSSLPVSPGGRYLQERRIRAEVSRKLRSWARTAGEAIAEELQDHTLDFCVLKTLSQDVSGRDKDMAFNWAFLLQQGTRETFRACVEQMSAAHSAQGLALELTGPWPPYNFCPCLTDRRGILKGDEER